MSLQQATTAANRFGLGARPGELAAAAGDPRGWLLAQLRTDPRAPSQFAGLPASADYLHREYGFQRDRLVARRAQRQRDSDDTMAAPALMNEPVGRSRRLAAVAAAQPDDVQQFVANFRTAFGGDLLAELAARYRQASQTPAGFSERLVRFWSNNFAISADKRPAALYAAPMEREAIRPHVLGRFEDLLLAVETHPGMLRYLDNVQSDGERPHHGPRHRPYELALGHALGCARCARPHHWSKAGALPAGAGSWKPCLSTTTCKPCPRPPANGNGRRWRICRHWCWRC